jgi:hypothetical protein
MQIQLQLQQTQLQLQLNKLILLKIVKYGDNFTLPFPSPSMKFPVYLD